MQFNFVQSYDNQNPPPHKKMYLKIARELSANSRQFRLGGEKTRQI